MKRKRSVHSFLAVKKKKVDNQEAALAEFLLLCESGSGYACKSCTGTWLFSMLVRGTSPFAKRGRGWYPRLSLCVVSLANHLYTLQFISIMSMHRFMVGIPHGYCCDYNNFICLCFCCAAALTYFLTKATAEDDAQKKEDFQRFVQTYLDKYPDCQHILAPLELEREKRTQDLVWLKTNMP